MSGQSRVSVLYRLLVLVVSPLLAATASAAVAPADKGAKIDVFAKDGQSHFALHLAPTVARPVARPRDVVILFDTSASQTGSYRDKALAALDALLAGLRPVDQVQLFAVDLNAIPLMDHFTPVADGAVRRALAALRDRVPLGATDMEAALAATSAAFPPKTDPARARAAVYIGDGMSTANLLVSRAARPLVDALRAQQVPMLSYAIGPRLDVSLLACLARQTGGVLAVDGEDFTGGQIGNWLAAAVQTPVIWPAAVDLPSTLHNLSGRHGLPLRFDRDTILLGKGTVAQASVVKMRADVAGQIKDLQWKVAPAQPNGDFAFLESLVKSGQQDAGLSVPALGSEGLAELGRLSQIDAHALKRLGHVALAAGDADEAKQLATEALSVNATDAEAESLLRAAERAGQPGAAAPNVKFGLIGVDDATEPEKVAGVDADGGLLDAVDRDRRVMQQAIQTEVRTAINEARTHLTDAPELVTDNLKLELERVRKAPELDAGQCAQLSGQLEIALQDAARRSEEKVDRDLRAQEIEAELDARKQINRELVINQQKADQLLARFESLLDERQFRAAEEEADRAHDIPPALRNTPEPGEATATAMSPLVARTTGYVYDMKELVRRRHKGVVEALYSVEVAHIPQSDEPPIIYPSAEEWMLKTERRKKYAEAVSLYQPGSSEEKIYRELGNSTDLEFADTPLSDVVDYIKSKHDIEIQLDPKGLTDAAVDPSAPVTKSVKGISLRSALRLILEEFDLTYVVQDEVLKITSKEKADEILTTRVYPVADLVIPIRTMMGGMRGGMGGGMMGGMGGGMGGGMMGGMGGGMGGGMMGGMGGGMGGMGGGMFNVPPEIIPISLRSPCDD